MNITRNEQLDLIIERLQRAKENEHESLYGVLQCIMELELRGSTIPGMAASTWEEVKTALIESITEPITKEEIENMFPDLVVEYADSYIPVYTYDQRLLEFLHKDELEEIAEEYEYTDNIPACISVLVERTIYEWYLYPFLDKLEYHRAYLREDIESILEPHG